MLEAERYTSPSRLDAEKRVLFRRCPIIVGRESELATTGRFFTHDAAGVPLLLAREGDRVHALLNVCRHRSARLVFEEEGSAESFVCRYHAWRYDLGGQLHRPGRVALPAAAQQFVDECALTSFPCVVRHGFVWVLATPRASLDAPAALGELDHVLADLDVARHAVVSRTIETCASNWKHVVEEHLASASLIFPSSIFSVRDGTVSHLAVFPSTVDESILVHTTLAAPDGARGASVVLPRTDARGFHDLIDRTIAAHPMRA